MKLLGTILRWICGLILMVPFVYLTWSFIDVWTKFKKDSGDDIALEALRHPDAMTIVIMSVALLLFMAGAFIIGFRRKRPNEDS